MSTELPFLSLKDPYVSGQQVLLLQEMLENAGYRVYGKDGVFGPMTDQALRRFQEAVGLVADGIAGPQTWNELRQSAGRHKAIRSLWNQSRLESQSMHRFDEGADTPTNPLHIMIQPGSRLMTLYRQGENLRSFPIAVGKPSTPTPPGEWKVVTKVTQPGGILGARWMGLNIPWGNYGIHGTNADWSIGRAISNGCIRMHNHDVIWLFESVERGTPVYVQS